MKHLRLRNAQYNSKLYQWLSDLFMICCFYRILGTSGQPVEDMYHYSNIDNHLDLLEDTLVAGHMAPTAPDTLGNFEIVGKKLQEIRE